MRPTFPPSPPRSPRSPRLPVIAVAIVVLAAACSSGTGNGSASPSASAAAGGGGGVAKDKLAQILARTTLVGYAALDYAPQSYVVEGAKRPADTKCEANQLTAPEVTGFDNETTKLVAKGLGVEACFVTPTWTEVTAGNWGDRWDIVYGSGSINADRMKRLYMTQPYYATPNRYFVKKDSRYQTAKEFSGKKIGSCASCTHEYYLKRELVIPGVKLEFEVENPQIVAYETEPPGMKDVAAGKLDAFLAAEPVGQQAIDDGLPLRALDKVAFEFYPSGFVDKSSGLDSKAFVNKVNSIVRGYQADGTLKALSMRFFKKDYATGGAAFNLDTIGQQVP